MRYLILIHRYLGTAIGIVMVGWCLTGIVMMYVRYPQLSATQRLHSLPPIAWQKCCAVSAAALPDDTAVEGFQLENLADHPALQLQLARGPRLNVDLATGESFTASFAAAGERGRCSRYGRPPRFMALIAYDEWTVSGEFNRARPLYQFALDDASGTQVYVSSRSGRMVQSTTAQQRFWNWLGSVPHWLYFTQLRHQPRLWTQVVIWTSVAGCF